jgi:hypothetical protein
LNKIRPRKVHAHSINSIAPLLRHLSAIDDPVQ